MAGYVAEFEMASLRAQPPTEFSEDACWLRGNTVFDTYEAASEYASKVAKLCHDVHAYRITPTTKDG
jgi:hypothetical protein